ncbi:MAG: pantoate--beta-alanine ligase [Lentimicrobiaceae bacterium]|nr:pantoate--beta-alanine ligase [Lentimicrobiaceae bacterium]
MKVFNFIVDVQRFVEEKHNLGLKIGFVPTMGALHEGHLSLINRAKKENDIVVCSVFVNPIQFNNPADLEKYPRTPEKDIEKLEQAGCDAVFMPTAEEMYPNKVEDHYDFGDLERVMEGACRPGHFNGVAIVVRKLFEIVTPNRAYFGEKDFQQLAIINKMVSNLNMNLEIVPCPIIREHDGLAMSSRNVRLNEAERAIAPKIFATLNDSITKKDVMSPAEMKNYALKKYAEIKEFDVEYVEITDEINLKSIENWDECDHARIFVALQLGPVRLIDNVRIF